MPQPIIAHGGAILKLVSTDHYNESHDNAKATVVSYGVDGLLLIWLLCIEKEFKEKHTLMKIMAIPISFTPSCIATTSLCLAITLGNKIYTYDIPQTDNGGMKVITATDQAKTNQSEDSHTNKITSISVHQTLNLIATSSQDGEIKIWDSSCDIVADITMDSIVNTVCFMPAEPSLLIGSHGELSIIPTACIFPQRRFTAELYQSEQPMFFNPEIEFWYVNVKNSQWILITACNYSC